jgi:uncharacterized protein (TIGR02001 family)
MSLNKLTLALSLALFASPMAALAQDADSAQDTETTTEEAVDSTEAVVEEAEPNLTWNLSLTSDYVFRGVSQSNRDPALQGGLDYAFGDTGFYVGAWGSNVDFADVDGPDIEIDAYLGWNHDFGDTWNLDLSLVRYNYFGAREDIYGDVDYNELVGMLTYQEMLCFTLGYANDYANTGESSLYYNLGGEWELGHGINLNAAIGYTDFEDTDGYVDWNIGLSRKFGPVEAALSYVDTDANDDYDDSERLSDALVLSFKIGG